MPRSSDHCPSTRDKPPARLDREEHDAGNKAPISENLCPSVEKKTGRRGGRRPGAGAPKGNLNALKHGAYSRQFAQLGALVAASPAACQALLRLIDRHHQRNRAVDELADYILGQIIARGLKKGRDRLILLPPVDDEDSISQNAGFDEEKTNFHPRDNQSTGTKIRGQSEIR